MKYIIKYHGDKVEYDFKTNEDFIKEINRLAYIYKDIEIYKISKGYTKMSIKTANVEKKKWLYQNE